MKPKRRPPSGSVRRVQHIAGNIPIIITNKTGRTVQCESHLEYRAALRLDRDPTVRDYASQCETFYYVDKKGKLHTYTPDFKVWRVDGTTEILEITVSTRFETSENLADRKEGAELICNANGWKHILFTEKELPSDTEFANLVGVYCYHAKGYDNDAVRNAIQSCLITNQPVHINPLVKSIVSELNLIPATVNAALFHMLWKGELETDWQKLLFIEGRTARNAQIWIPSKS